MGDAIPDDVQRLLTEDLGSLLALELLLLLRADPARQWAAADLGRELHCGEDWVQGEARRLVSLGLAVATEDQPACFRLGPRAGGADSPVAWLAGAYPQRRFSIIQVLYAPPTRPLQSFSDAFKLRKDRPDG